MFIFSDTVDYNHIRNTESKSLAQTIYEVKTLPETIYEVKTLPETIYEVKALPVIAKSIIVLRIMDLM